MFTCLNEITISGGSAEERAKAAGLLAATAPGSDPEVQASAPEALRLRYETPDSLPEDEILLLAPQFPSLAIRLLYVSVDGEFCGFLEARGAESSEGSEDFPEGKRAELEARGVEEAFEYARGQFRGGPGA